MKDLANKRRNKEYKNKKIQKLLFNDYKNSIRRIEVAIILDLGRYYYLYLFFMLERFNPPEFGVLLSGQFRMTLTNDTHEFVKYLE